MDFNSEEEIDIPERIINRLNQIQDEVQTILTEATSNQVTTLKQIQFRFHQCADKDILSDFERAQSVCFVAKYESLPELEGVVVEEENGRYYFQNLNVMRHILNEFRPIILNQEDSIFYANIHKFTRGKLMNMDPSKDLVLDVLDENDDDVSSTFTKILDERMKSIRTIISRSDFKYIYNGILQHSDHEYTDRFWNEYYSGEINYLFLKHAMLLNPIKEMLHWHYRIINFLTFPKLGSL